MKLRWKLKCFIRWMSCQTRRGLCRTAVPMEWSATSLAKPPAFGLVRIQIMIRFVHKPGYTSNSSLDEILSSPFQLVWLLL